MDPEKAAAKELYNRYGFLIYRTCLNIVRSEDDARDAVQTVFMKLLEVYDRVMKKEKLVAWIFTTAKNHCYNLLRFQKKFRGSLDPDTTAGGDRFDERIADRELVRLAFLNHKKEVRDAVYFTHVEGFDQEEIRKLTGQSPATIRRNLNRFKESVPGIKKRLGDSV